MDAAEVRARVAAAKQRLLKAENELEAALHQIGRAPRADKSIISGALSAAFTELKAARQDLSDLEQAIEPND